MKKAEKMLLDEIVQVCNGKLTKAEAYGFSDIAVDHVCRFSIKKRGDIHMNTNKKNGTS